MTTAGTATITKATQTSTRLGLKAFCQGRRGKLQPANVREYLAASAVDLPDDDDKAFSLEELQATWLKVDVTFKKVSSRPDATKELVVDRMHNYKQKQAQLPVRLKERDSAHVVWDKFFAEVAWQVHEQVLEQRDLVTRIRLANLGAILVLLHDSGLGLADVLHLTTGELCVKGRALGTGWPRFLQHLRQPSWPPLPEMEFRASQVQNRLYSRSLRRWQFGPPDVVPDYLSAVWWLGKLHKLRLRLGEPISCYLFRDPG